MILSHAALAVPIVLILLVFAVGAASADPLPLLPSSMCIPDLTGAPLAPPNLVMTGVPLVLSNSPETLVGAWTDAGLYRVSLTRDHFRVFFHHRNMTGNPLKIGIAITNPAAAKNSVVLYAGRNCQMLPGACQSTVSTDPATAGSIALRNWFQSKPDDSYLRALAPGTTYYALQDVPHESTATGMYDFGVRVAGKSKDAPNVIVTVLACVTPPYDPTAIDIPQPEKTRDGSYRRGTFAHSDRVGTIECDVSQVYWLDIAGPSAGPHARPLGNEVERAMDDPNGMNPGNYGVVYSLRVIIKNPTPDPVRTRCIISAAGGPSFSNIAVNQAYSESGKLLGSYGSWVFKDFSLDPSQVSDFRLNFSLPGGSNGAHRLYIWPGNDADPNVVKSIDIQL